ncbi:MAG: hypothetical protein Q4B96_07545, partial [Bacillota bacterium]|nr:hypothetical protein [Bacillota bacterium]
ADTPADPAADPAAAPVAEADPADDPADEQEPPLDLSGAVIVESGSENSGIDVALAGYFVCADENSYAPGYFPSLTLNEDGSCEFYVNLAEAMGTVSGYWQISADGRMISLIVESRDFSGFTGDDVDEFVFEVLDNDRILFQGPQIGLIWEGATVFTRN